MSGVQVCSFALAGEQTLPLYLEPLHFETLFCLKGGMTVECGGRVLRAEAGDILLLSDGEWLHSARICGGLEGSLVVVDAGKAGESLRTLCCLMGYLELDTAAVREIMDRRKGCGLLKRTPWSRAVFEVLERLEGVEQGRYCIWKTVELLYLLCKWNGMLEERGSDSPVWRTGAEIGVYLERHMGEKLTIAELSRRFCLSQTALKNYFRQVYGVPVHTWLRRRRMERAARLLRTSSLSVLEISQAVGYEGISQFNVTFKDCYGMTPGTYRKMSETGG
ncbi:MAG: AraC family transcriptional regulator [Clostridiales bacterium]|nr:AraC family transcriptional regulator [Clostridiales bacterium]